MGTVYWKDEIRTEHKRTRSYNGGTYWNSRKQRNDPDYEEVVVSGNVPRNVYYIYCNNCGSFNVYLKTNDSPIVMLFALPAVCLLLAFPIVGLIVALLLSPLFFQGTDDRGRSIFCKECKSFTPMRRNDNPYNYKKKDVPKNAQAIGFLDRDQYKK